MVARTHARGTWSEWTKTKPPTPINTSTNTRTSTLPPHTQDETPN